MPFKTSKHSKNGIAINKYTLNGTFIRTYKSLTAAVKSVNRTSGTDLHDAIKGSNDIYRNYKWSLVTSTPTFNPTIKTTNDNICNVCDEYAKYRCSQCKSVKYCSGKCQMSHWSEHKIKCISTLALALAPAPAPAPAPSPAVTTTLTETKYTPDTIHGNTNMIGAKQKYINFLKTINVDNIKQYLIMIETNLNMKYIALPELLKYLITNPAIMIHHKKFRSVIIDKMIDFETEISTAKKIGPYIITEGYRRELTELIKTAKKVAQFYSDISSNLKD